MRPFLRFSLFWLAVPVGAVAFCLWSAFVRLHQVEFVTALEKEAPQIEVSSPTGYAGGTRALIVPAHASESYDWIIQTQQMLQRNEWRIRHADYDNAPFGRDVGNASPYRWYLGAIASLDHRISERPLGLSVERAALYAGPLLHLLVLLAAVTLVAWQFGFFPAALLSIGMVGLFPFAAGFLPGAPDHFAMGQAWGLVSMILLLAGFRHLSGSAVDTPRDKKGVLPASAGFPQRWFIAAGIAGAIALWIDPLSQLLMLAGILVGALFAFAVLRKQVSEEFRAALARSWRAWGVAGAATALLAYLLEFYPQHLGEWHFDRIHPLGAISWLGAAELLARLAAGRGPGKTARRTASYFGILAVATIAVMAFPLVLGIAENASFFPHARSVLQLTKLPDAAVAENFWAWVRRGDGRAQLGAILLPMLALLPVLWSVVRRKTDVSRRFFLIVGMGPLLTAMLLAAVYLRWWQQLDVAWLVVVLAAAVVFENRPTVPARQWAWLSFVAVLLVPGLIQLLPPRGEARKKIPLQEVDGLIERDLARWLARRTGGSPDVVVWAPPSTTTALVFYGGLRGIGSFAEENGEGLTAAVGIAGSHSAPEALARLSRRGVTHLVLPSWDSYFDDLMTPGGEKSAGTFLETLRRWELPVWLRPVPYQFRKMAGIEDYGVAVFEVVNEQEEPIALSRQAEYFAEMGQLEAAARTAGALQRFPNDLGALVARAQVSTARGDAAELAQTTRVLKTRLGSGADRYLPWDRRVSLALVLVRENELERAGAQVRRCVTEMNAVRIRELNPGMLFNLLVLIDAFQIELPDPSLRSLAKELLPIELRNRL